ncbi:nickel pincer cofactor biosynthesis protein LarC [Candidatus Margulisiibacteriota bacterium]
MKNCKIAYFDCSSGIAGNMVLGALIDAGLSVDTLRKELKKLPITHYSLLTIKTKRSGVTCSLINIKLPKNEKPRYLKDILAIIKKSKLSKQVKTLSSRIFKRLAEAEAKVHGTSINKIHFHEVGATDAIIDIVGTAIGLEKLGIKKVYASPIPFGKGSIKHAHGKLPIPVPATAELTKNVPTYGTNIKGELVTPTGAAIITTIADSFGDMPRLKVEAIGHGAGSKTFPSLPSFLRIVIGQAELPTEKDAILQIEANIDDMDPKLYDQAIKKMMQAGALDASVHLIRMKKKRGAVKLEVLCKPEDKDKILDVIFSVTTTIGTRVYLVKREKLRREIKKKKKISYLGSEIKRVKPERV